MDIAAPTGLDALRAEIRRDLERLNHPPPNWPLGAAGPDGRPALEVLVVGGGMFGQTAAFALQRDGVRNLRVVDRAARGEEGPWGTYARMPTLRSPKQLNGPDLGIPSLTFRAFFEAQHGAAGWDALYKIDRLDWRDYLLFLRDVLGIPVENGVTLVALEPAGDLIRATLQGPRGEEAVFARQVVLASGREGSGGRNMPVFPSLPNREAGGDRVFHSAEVIPFERFRGGRIAVLGANASAFDNAATALEAGVAEVVMSARRPFLPQVNKTRGMSAAFQRGFAGLDDRTRWQMLTLLAGVSSPPPHESVLRCLRHPGFSLRFSDAWTDLVPGPEGVTVVTATERRPADAAILATGFAVDLGRRPELAAFAPHALLWRDRVDPEEAARFPELARYPYLGPGYELVEREPGACPALARLRLFNGSGAISHGVLTPDIPGLASGALRVSQSVSQAILQEELDRHREALLAFEEPELLPTPFFVPPDQRRR
ncbi:FAD-dependent oxidoreductase [Roseomonas sp. BN140053]|uniref:FAD-dependent oxidoreductase n=1 Tax=Roseomonas sp. BN140053 TaxID=3391898 RepID=UPI0039E8B64A